MTYPRCHYCGRATGTAVMTRLGACCPGPKGCAAFVEACADADQIPPEHRHEALEQFRWFGLRQEIARRPAPVVEDPFTGVTGAPVGSIVIGGA